MEKDSLISVIMSAYNEDLKWIKESVESILNQTYDNLEFIIILDNPDNSQMKEVLENYRKFDNRINLIVNEKNEGLVKSLNIALQHCSGKYIARMDADDISIENRIEKQKHYLESNNLDFVYSGVKVIDECSNEIYESNNTELKPDKVKMLLEITNCTYHPTWFIKSEVYRELGGYREVSYCEDYDFSLRAIRKGYKIGKMNENILKYRVRSSSISTSYSLEQFLNMKGILKLYKKNQLEKLDFVDSILKESKKIASVKEKENFIKARCEYNKAVEMWKNNRKARSILSLISSCMNSKYYLIVYKDMLKYKVILNR